MKIARFSLTALLAGCLVTMLLTGCTYHKRKKGIETDISVMEQGIKKETEKHDVLTGENETLKKTKGELEQGIADLEVQKKLLQEKLKTLQKQLNQESKPQAEACGKVCQDVKTLKKDIAKLKKSIEKKTLELENR